MVSTDPIADMLTRIRNAVLVNQNTVSMPYSKLKESIASLLKANEYLAKVETSGEGIAKRLSITISKENANPNFKEITRISKPGRRLYAKAGEVPTVKNGRGIVIVSTSRGLMTGMEAKKNKVGGELICKVY